MEKNKPNATRRPEDSTATDAEHPIGPNNTTVPQKERSVLNAVNGHYAKCYRSTRKIKTIADEGTFSADEDDWRPDRKHSIQQKINSMGTKCKNGPRFYTKSLLVNNRSIKSIVDTGSPVTLIPKTKFSIITTMKPVTVDYRDVNDKKIQRKTTFNIEIDGTERKLELLITTKQTHPLLGLDWMEKLGITLNTGNNVQTIKHFNKPDHTNCG